MDEGWAPHQLEYCARGSESKGKWILTSRVNCQDFQPSVLGQIETFNHFSITSSQWRGWPLNWFEDAHHFWQNLAEHRSFYSVCRGSLHRISLQAIIPSPQWHWCPSNCATGYFTLHAHENWQKAMCFAWGNNSLLNKIAQQYSLFLKDSWLCDLGRERRAFFSPDEFCFSSSSPCRHQG